MPTPICIVMPGALPSLETLEKYQMPPGTTGFTAVTRGHTPAMAVMPTNEALALKDQLSSYLMAVTCASMCLLYDKLVINVNLTDRHGVKDIFVMMLGAHLANCELDIAKALMQEGVSAAEIKTLQKLGLKAGHDLCCPMGPDCKDEIDSVLGIAKS